MNTCKTPINLKYAIMGNIHYFKNLLLKDFFIRWIRYEGEHSCYLQKRLFIKILRKLRKYNILKYRFYLSPEYEKNNEIYRDLILEFKTCE